MDQYQHKQSMLCGVIYKPPDVHYSAFSSLEDLIAEASTTSKNIMCMGDFNVNFLVDGPDVTYLKHITDAYNLKQMITSPIRVVSDSSKLIDLFFVSTQMVYVRRVLLDYLASLIIV